MPHENWTIRVSGHYAFLFNFPYQGLNNRLIGPTEEGRVLTDILA